MPTRRQFLLECSALAATAALTPASALGAQPPLGRVPLERIRQSDFVAQLDSTFRVRASTTEVEVRLVEVRPRLGAGPENPAAADAQNEKFALLFSGPLAPRLEQDTYPFTHPNLGRFALFIALIGHTDQTRRYYEAIFNRPLPGAAHGRPAAVPGRAR
jgi:hypothetical protein